MYHANYYQSSGNYLDNATIRLAICLSGTSLCDDVQQSLSIIPNAQPNKNEKMWLQDLCLSDISQLWASRCFVFRLR